VGTLSVAEEVLEPCKKLREFPDNQKQAKMLEKGHNSYYNFNK